MLVGGGEDGKAISQNRAMAGEERGGGALEGLVTLNCWWMGCIPDNSVLGDIVCNR